MIIKSSSRLNRMSAFGFVADSAAAFLLVFAAALVGCLFFGSLLISSMFVDVRADGVGADLTELVTPLDSGLFSAFLLPLIVLLALVIVFYHLNEKLRVVSWAKIAFSSVSLIFVFSVIWVLLLDTDTCIYPDSIRLDQFARALLANDYSVFSTDLGDGIPYLQLYPFQSGSVWLLAWCYSLFGVGNQLPFQLFGSIAVALSASSLIAIGKMLFERQEIVNAISLLLALFIPLPLSAAFVYGNAVGLGLILLAIALNIASMREEDKPTKRWLLFVLACFFSTLSIIIKSTFTIMLIAIVLTWAIVLLKERKLPILLFVIAGVFIVNKVVSLPVHALEQTVGYSFGDGMPKASWIAMGLDWNSYLNKPGWWAPDLALHYASVGGDAAAQNTFALERIGDAFTTFLSNPLYAIRFFAVKLMTEWFDPTYQSVYYSATSMSANTSELARDLIANGGKLNRLVSVYADGYQTLLYAMSFVGLICSVKHREALRFSVLLLAITFLGGFACYLLWEAKSVYVFPFALMLFPFAGYGVDALCGAVRTCMARGTVRAES